VLAKEIFGTYEAAWGAEAAEHAEIAERDRKIRIQSGGLAGRGRY
jgi:hypothetical protein